MSPSDTRQRHVFKVRDPTTGLYWNGKVYSSVLWDKVGREWTTKKQANEQYIKLCKVIGVETAKAGPSSGPRGSPPLDTPLDLEFLSVTINETITACERLQSESNSEIAAQLAIAEQRFGSQFHDFFRTLMRLKKRPYTHIIEIDWRVQTSVAGFLTHQRTIDFLQIKERLAGLGVPRSQTRHRYPFLAVQSSNAALALRMIDEPITKIVNLRTLELEYNRET